MRRQRLLHERRAGARKAEDEDRLRDVAAHAGARQGLQALRGEEALQAIDQRCCGLIEILVAASLADQLLALFECGKRFVVMAHLVEQAAFLRQLVRAELAFAGLRQFVEHLERRVIFLGAA